MKKMIFLNFLIMIFLCNCNAQNLSLSDFSCRVNNTIITLGDSLLKYSDICNIKEYSIKESGNMKYKVYECQWGSIYVSDYSDELIIYGIIITGNEIKIKNNISIGCTRKKVINVFGDPEYESNHDLYYYYDDFDVLELKLSFTENNLLAKIQLFMGT